MTHPSRWLSLLTALLVGALAALTPCRAWAYPFMIGHGYTACAQCHVDPSGGNALTAYGRGQSEIFMRTVYQKRAAGYEPGKIKDFAFGVPLPTWLTLQGDARALGIPEPGNFRFLVMQADMRAGLQFGRFQAYGSAGYVSEGASGAWFTSNTTGGNLVTREYWIGYNVKKGLLARAGRLALPFGIRDEEHMLYARSYTRTDTNDNQQVGLDGVYGNKKWRVELMGIAGNFQLSPSDFRERGYSGLAAYALSKNLEVGVSSLMTQANLDVELREERFRQVHGVFARWAPIEPVRFLGEAHVLLDSIARGAPAVGSVGYLQVDGEPVQGLHLKATGEWCDDDLSDTSSAALRGSGTVLWFLAPHTDLRFDALYGPLYCSPGTPPQPMGLAQLHFFL